VQLGNNRPAQLGNNLPGVQLGNNRPDVQLGNNRPPRNGPTRRRLGGAKLTG